MSDPFPDRCGCPFSGRIGAVALDRLLAGRMSFSLTPVWVDFDGSVSEVGPVGLHCTPYVGRRHVIKDAGHLPQWEKTNEFACGDPA